MVATSKVIATLDNLRAFYPNLRCGLHYTNPFELLIATILSAQCTDRRVNEITADLFRLFPSPAAFAASDEAQISQAIHGCGLYQNKARFIHETSQLLVERHGGQVPTDRDKLMSLPGVGRKTAHVVLSNAFGIPAFAVDTHVLRVSNRLGWANNQDPLKVEAAVTALVPEDRWNETHQLLIRHGREICAARKPRCTECPIQADCLWYEQNPQ